MRKRITWLLGLTLWGAWGLTLATTEMPQGLQEAVNAARHAIEAQGAEYIARNPRNGQRIAFRDGGIFVSPLAVDPDQDPGWTWGLRLAGYGTSGNIQAVAEPQRNVAGTRLEYRRGPITEWYENRPAGLEQGFTLREPPVPGAADLVLVLALQGDLSAAWETSGQSVSFHTPAGDYALTYRDLKVVDGAGESLPAHLALGPDRLEIQVDARAAVWPIVVDPLVVNQQAKLTAADGLDQDEFGFSVALSGDTALVGAPGDDPFGSAYVFIRSVGTWRQQAKLTPANSTAGPEFGVAVALAGDTALVGAYRDSDQGTESGAAYVFTRSGSIWSPQAKLTGADTAKYHWFGVSVAIAGDTVLVGAEQADGRDKWDQAGAAYVFTRTGSTWSQQAKLTALDGDFNDGFGNSVALFGNTALVGAPAIYSNDQYRDPGSAYNLHACG